MAQKKNTFIYLAAALLFAGGLGWLVFSGLSENSVYFLNVAEAFKDENGNLIAQYCSDPTKMGMHFTYEGTKVWVDYLKTHVPPELLERLELA